ncbi:hypothetical protein Poly30_21640 [Planctomycetes bacterium Poly30]|uniref:Uncharacterized protein n=1 Tax=Saltatorellus ferox TaxID=2528018 RepID=A0A518ERD2_9BACT|nr:hypothetical protein Poly30_21640 [Planctomycetes bacterium Poly30]
MKLALLALLSLAATAAAQSPPTPSAPAPGSPAPLMEKPERQLSPARHAGTYHVTTGTWTRRTSSTAAFGPDVVYDNTAYSGYFTSAGSVGGFMSGGMVVDEGGLPGTANGHAFPGTPDRDLYSVDGFEISYCDMNGPGTSGWEISFYQSYEPCEFQPSLIPDATVRLTGLPANGGCWVMQIDLSGGSEFCMGADGGHANPLWEDDPEKDSFGWSTHYLGSGTQSAGFMLAGDPLSTDPGFVLAGPFSVPTFGAGTYFGPTSACGNPTGYLTRDILSFRPASGTGYASCNSYFYRNQNPCSGTSGPYSSLHLRLSADSQAPSGSLCSSSCTETVGIGTAYCSQPNTSAGRPGLLCAGGSAAVADAYVILHAARLPTGSFGFFITSLTQGFVAQPGGSRGNLCLGGDIGRFVAPHQIRVANEAGTFALDTRVGDWSVTSIPISTGNYAASAGVTSNFQAWFRDVWNQQPTSNFTNASAITWE